MATQNVMWPQVVPPDGLWLSDGLLDPGSESCLLPQCSCGSVDESPHSQLPQYVGNVLTVVCNTDVGSQARAETAGVINEYIFSHYVI